MSSRLPPTAKITMTDYRHHRHPDDDHDDYSRYSDLTPTSASRSSNAGARTAFRAIRNVLDGGRAWKAEERERMENELLEHLTELERAKNEEIAELQVKVAGRDSALASLERTVEMQGHTVQMLRGELEEVRAEGGEGERRWMEKAEEARAELEAMRGNMSDRDGTHTAEVDAMKSEHDVTIAKLKAENDALKRKVHEKKKVIVSQNRQMREFQEYIVELTDELEKLYGEIEEDAENGHRDAADGGGTARDDGTVGAQSVMRHRQELERRLQIWENGGGSTEGGSKRSK